MKKMFWLLMAILFLSGCAGTGFNKKATLIPDIVGLYYEVSPTGIERDYKTLKIGGKTEWKFQ
jgi:hypothetical protein